MEKSRIIRQGDFVDYIPDFSAYVTNPNNTGLTAKKFETNRSARWRVLYIDERIHKVFITTEMAVNRGMYFSGINAYINGATELHNMSSALYSSANLNINARSMTIEDLNKACGFSPMYPMRQAFYLRKDRLPGKFVEYEGNIYECYTMEFAINAPKLYTSDGGGVLKVDENGFKYRVPDMENPVFVTENFYFYRMPVIVRDILNICRGWLASQYIEFYAGDVEFGLRMVSRSGFDKNVLWHFNTETRQPFTVGIRPLVGLDINYLKLDEEADCDGICRDWVIGG